MEINPQKEKALKCLRKVDRKAMPCGMYNTIFLLLFCD